PFAEAPDTEYLAGDPADSGCQIRQSGITAIECSARETADDTATITTSGRTTETIIAIAVHPFDAQFFTGAFFNLNNDCFNKNLRATNIQTLYDRQQRFHSVAVCGEQNRIGVDIKLNVCSRGGGSTFGRRLSLRQVLHHAGQNFRIFFRFSVLKIYRMLFAVFGLGTIHTVDKQFNALTLQSVPTHDDAVDSLVGHNYQGC